VRFAGIQYGSDDETVGFQPYSNGPLDVALDITSDADRTVGTIAVTLYDEHGTKLVNVDTILRGQGISLQKGRNVVRLKVRELYLNPGVYVLGLWVADPPAEIFDHNDSAIRIEVVQPPSKASVRALEDGSVVCEFEILDVAAG